MTSMRRLNRRLTRWQRYGARYRDRCDYAVPWGHINAKAAVVDEIGRRQLFAFYDVCSPDDSLAAWWCDR